MEQAAVTGVEAALAKGRADEQRSPLSRAEMVQGSTQRALDRALEMANKRGEELEAVRGDLKEAQEGRQKAGLEAAQLLRRHKLPTPHPALWPTEVHVVVRVKVCEKGCYFLGIHTPWVATCKNKVCISNICHYLHFWKHTDFQNKDNQSPTYSVVLHLDHCIPVREGGGLPISSLPFFPE